MVQRIIGNEYVEQRYEQLSILSVSGYCNLKLNQWPEVITDLRAQTSPILSQEEDFLSLFILNPLRSIQVIQLSNPSGETYLISSSLFPQSSRDTVDQIVKSTNLKVSPINNFEQTIKQTVMDKIIATYLNAQDLSRSSPKVSLEKALTVFFYANHLKKCHANMSDEEALELSRKGFGLPKLEK